MFDFRGKGKNKEINFAEIDPVHEIGDNLVILKTGDITILYKLDLPEMEQWESGQYEGAILQLAGAMKNLPVGTVFQKIDIYYNAVSKETFRCFDFAQQPPCQGKTGKLIKKIEEHFGDDKVLRHKCYIALSFAKKLYDVHPVSTFFSMRKSVFKDPFENIDSRIDEAEKVAYSFSAGVSSINDIKLKRLKKEEIYNLYYQYMNLEFSCKQTDINRNLINESNCLVIGEKKVSIISMSGQAETVSPSRQNAYNVTSPFLYPLTHYMNYPHILVQTIKIRDTEKEMKALDQEMNFNAMLGGLAKQGNLIKKQQIEEFTADIRVSGELLVSLAVQLIIHDTNDEKREQKIKDIINIFPMLNGASAKVESYDTSSLFFANLPGNMNQNFRWLLVPLNVACCYVPFTTTYQSDSNGEYICDRNRNLVKVNLFNTELNNQNAVIIGPSGSGKSFTIGHFVAQRFEKGQKQLIIDIGGSYKNLVEALQGQYYEYDLEKPLQFNPFLISKDHNKQYNLNDEKKNFLIALILTVWKGDNVSEVPKEAITVLNIWLELYYNEINESIKEGKDELPTIRGFINWLTAYDKNNTNKEHETHKRYIDINSLLLVISPFTEGKYKDILNYTKTEDLSDYDLVCFDLQKVKNDPAIFNVVAMIITELSLDQIRKYPDRRKYLYMDEAWSLLSNMGEWIETMFRTIRKNNGSINIITQGIEEIIASKIGSAIIRTGCTET